MNCSGHGFCNLQGGIPTCSCMPSFTGEGCNIELPACPTELNNCTGHGLCKPTSANSIAWECVCESGFCGTSCNRVCPTCPNNCTGHGICVGSTCQCDPGFLGSDCTQVVPIVGCPDSCSGHGRCREVTSGKYQCECDLGFIGLNCALVSGGCPGNCSGKGECIRGECACSNGYTGASCNRALGTCAASNNCSGNGLCVNGSCSCYPGFRGADCSRACYENATGNIGCNHDKNHGVCTNGTCTCLQYEWKGEWCEIEVHETDIGKVTSSNNPLGVVVLSVVCVGALFAIAGFTYNYMTKGKRGLNAVPGMDAMRSAVKGDDYEAAPENRYASNY